MKKLISGLILLMASFLVFAENTAIDLAVEAMDKKDYETAKKLFEPEAYKGDEYALAYMGDIYYYGYGVDKDYKKARSFYEKAAAKGQE